MLLKLFLQFTKIDSFFRLSQKRGKKLEAASVATSL